MFELGAFVAVRGFWWAENADNPFNDGLGYCFGCFIANWNSTANRVRWSIIERMYLHSIPAAEGDTDLYSTKLTDILWKGHSTGKWPVGSFGLLCAVFRH